MTILTCLLFSLAVVATEFRLYKIFHPTSHFKQVIKAAFHPAEPKYKLLIFLSVCLVFFSVWESALWALLGHDRPWWRLILSLAMGAGFVVTRWRDAHREKSYEWNATAWLWFPLCWVALSSTFSSAIFGLWIFSRFYFSARPKAL